MAAIAAAAKLGRFMGELDDDELEGVGSQLGDALRDPDVLRELVRQPGSKLVGAGSRLLTGRALQMAWYGLIPSYGLTLLYLNFHYFANHFAHRKGFTPLGSEWKIWRMVLGWPSFGLKYAEFLALFFLDVLAIMILLAIATLLGMIAYAVTHPCEFIGKIGYTNALVFAALSGASGGAVAAVVGGCAVVNAVAG